MKLLRHLGCALQGGRPPHGGRGLKYCWFDPEAETGQVAPHTGGVD